MRILLVNGGIFPVPTAKGGTENVIYNLSNSLAKAGHDIDLVSDTNANAYFHPNIAIHPVGIPRLPIYNLGFWGYTSRFVIGGLYAFRAARRLLKYKHDIVHVHGRLAPYLLSFHVKENLVYTVHDDPPKKGTPHYLIYRTSYKWFTEGTAKKADGIITLHSDTEDYLRNIGIADHKIVQIPNGVNTEVFRPYHNGRKGFSLYVGSLIPRKGVNYLLQALSQIDDLPCIIVGDGSEKTRLMRMTQKLGLDERVKFVSAITEPARLVDLYNAASFFVLPSLNESFGLVLLESMACGTPVIASRLPGPSTIVHDSTNGFLFDPGNVDQLSHKMKTLMNSPSLRHRMGQNGLILAREQYSWDSVTTRIIQAYEYLLSKTQ